jgi:DUF4097 and DUF4098 domain-containing protein YvlB
LNYLLIQASTIEDINHRYPYLRQPGGIELKVNEKLITVLAVLAITAIAALIGGCISINPGSVTTTEHMEVTTAHSGADNITLDVSTVNGNVEIQEASDSNVTVIYEITASKGHLYDVVTGTNGTRVDNNTVHVTAEAKIAHPDDGFIGSRGANIIVKVPRGTHYDLTLNTMNGNVIVPGISGASFSRIDAATMNGDVNIKLHEGTLFYVDASTMNGRVRHGYIHMAPVTENDRTLIGPTEAGSGSLQMTLSTMNGDIGISY